MIKLTLTKDQWWTLRCKYAYLDPSDIWNYNQGEHVRAWLNELKEQYKATSYSEQKVIWGTITFEKEEHVSWFLLSL